MIDYKGNVIIPFEWDELMVYDADNRILRAKKGNKQGLLRMDNTVLLDSKYMEIYGYINGWAHVVNEFFENIYVSPDGREFVEVE